MTKDEKARFDAIRAARDDLPNGSGIIINWSPPMPDPVPGMRYDPGGYIYQIFRNGFKCIGGSSHSSLEDTKARAVRYAAEKGIENPVIVVIDRRIDMTNTTPLGIEFDFTSYDEGYRPQDWLKGGVKAIYEAENANTPEEAHRILLDAYKGADCDGVHMFWHINGVTYRDSLKKPSVD